MLAGGWVSVLMFRRCAMAVAGSIFEQRVDQTTGDSGSSLVHLCPAARQELVLLAVLAPLLATCVSLPYDRRLFASDASLRKGAFTYTRPDLCVLKALWLSADARGFYTKLDGPLRASLSALGVEPLEPPSPDEPPALAASQHGTFYGGAAPVLSRPLGQRFDFLLVGPGPPDLVSRLRSSGFTCGPVIDESVSRHFRLDCPDVLEWVMHLLPQGRVGFLALFLPSGALSASALGFKSGSACSEFAVAGVLPQPGLALFWLAWRVRVPSVLLLSGTSCVASSARLGYLRSLPGVSCQAGLAVARVLAARAPLLLCASDLDLDTLDSVDSPFAVCSPVPLRSRAPGHCPVLVRALASLVQPALASADSSASQKVGYESLLVNDQLAAGRWKVGSAWTWPSPPEHINVLETKAFLAVLRQVCREGGDKRLVQVVDSSVTLGATAKGRSSARTLRRPLLQACALQLAWGLYPASVFGPTRLNTSDAPTRDKPLPEPASLSLCGLLQESELLFASTFRQLPRASANWLRLACLLVGFRSPTPLGGFLRSLVAPWRLSRPSAATSWPTTRLDSVHHGLDFDATLGYPGEGPLHPRGQRDSERLTRRASSALPSGRPVLPRTCSNRARLLGQFDAWLAEHGSSLGSLTTGSPLDPAARARHSPTTAGTCTKPGAPMVTTARL